MNARDRLAEAHKLTDRLWLHQVWAFNGTQIGCSCDHQFRSQAQHREHLADALLPVVDALCAERAAEAEPILCPKCQGQGVVSRPSYVPAGCATWTSTTAVHRCNLCDGRMVISRARAAALAEADR